MTLEFQEVETRVRGKGYWKINSSIVDEEEYIKQLQDNKIKWLEEFKDIEDPRMIWELFKYKIRQFSMRYTKNRANVQKDNENKLEKESLRLHKQLDQETDNHVRLVIEKEIYQVNEKLKEVDKLKTDGAIFRSKCQWYENGEKNSNFFLSLEKNNYSKKLQKDNGTITTDPKEILNMQIAFYSNLYTSKSKKSKN